MPFLRRKKKQREPAEPPLGFEEAVSLLLSPEDTGAAEEIPFEEFETSLPSAEKVRVLFAYGESNMMPFLLIEPGTSTGTAEEPETRHRRLAAFLSLRPEGGEAVPAGKAEPFLLLEREFGRETREGREAREERENQQERKALLWLAAESTILRIPGTAGEGFLAVERGRVRSLRKALEENEAFRRFVRESIESGDFIGGGQEPGGEADSPELPRPAGTPERIELLRPHDFPAGYTLLPRRAPAGKKTAEVRFESIEMPASAEPGSTPNGGTATETSRAVWFTYTCRFASGTGSVYYSVSLQNKTEAHTKYFSALFTALVKYAAGFTQREIGPIKAGGKISAPPESSALRHCIRIEGGISVEDKLFPVHIYVTPAFIRAARAARNTLGRSDGGDNLEAEAVDSDRSIHLAGLLSLNLSILVNNIERIDRAGVFAEMSELLRVSELLNLLGTEDSRKVVQNLFLARGRGIQELTRLFYCRTGPPAQGDESGKAAPRLMEDPQFRRDDFLSLLPRNLREDWNPAAGYSESRGDLYSANREAVEEISEAAESDRLILSYRGRYLLRRAVRERVDAGYKRRVEEIMRKNLLGKLLGALSKPAAQRTVSAFPSDELARVLLADADTIETFAPFISKNKRQDVEEQHRRLDKDFDKGKLSFHSIYRSLYTLLTELKHAREKEEEQ